MASEPETNIVCFRGVPAWIQKTQWDGWNSNLQAHLLQQEKAFLSLPTYRGSRWLRAVLLNPYTQEETISQLFDEIDAYANA